MKGPTRAKTPHTGLNLKKPVVFPKTKLLVYIVNPKNVLILSTPPKNSPERPKKDKKYPKWG